MEPLTVQEKAELVIRVNTLLREAQQAGALDPVSLAAMELEWTEDQLNEFVHANRELITYDQQLPESSDPEAPDELAILVGSGNGPELPTEAKIAMAIEQSDSKLKTGLKKMGLTQAEADEWEACQAVSNQHFRESMDMISATVARQQLMLSIESRTIQKRLLKVREKITDADEGRETKRDMWIAEERSLVYQLCEVGNLMRANQDTWFRGSAQLALIRMRYGQKNGEQGHGPTKAVKPRFHPQRKEPIDVPS